MTVAAPVFSGDGATTLSATGAGLRGHKATAASASTSTPTPRPIGSALDLAGIGTGAAATGVGSGGAATGV